MNKKYSDLLASITNTPRGYNESVLLVDGLNTFLRSFCMINHVNPLGAHIGGLTGFLKSLGYIARIINPTRIIILFDGVGGSSARKNLYPGYKANRHIGRMTNYDIFENHKEEQDSIYEQMERLIQYLKCLPVSMISIDGLEADDIIGYMCGIFNKNEDCKKVTIVSADKDFLQLTNSKIEVYSPVKKIFYTTDKVKEEFKISSNNFIMYKTLMGDMSDNLPGVDGLGPKKLLKYFPELQSDNEFKLNEVFEKAKDGDHFIYDRVLERRNQLEINYQIMNLKDLPISNDNINLINNCVSNFPPKLSINGFMSLYHKDQLGEFIQYVEKWLPMTFGHLEKIN